MKKGKGTFHMESKKWNFLFLILIIIVLNLLILFVLKSRKVYKTNKDSQISSVDITRTSTTSNVLDIYNTPCPEITVTSIEGKIYNLSDMVGNVIILKFSKFYKRNLPDLVYLDHVVNKYKEEGISLFFINSLGKHYLDKINTICKLEHPIIEDEGKISALFNAGSEDIVIVDREFNVKFKFSNVPMFNKSLVFNEIMRWTFGDNKNRDMYGTSTKELSLMFAEIAYFDVFQNELKTLNIRDKRTIITLFTSTCLGCEDNARIRLLEDLSKQLKPQKSQIFLLFGMGNNAKAIRDFAEINNWDKFSFQIGILKKVDQKSERDYYKLFAFEVDPRTFILNKKGRLLFSEDFYNSNSIDLKLLLRGN